MAQFFDKFPVLVYDIAGKRLSNYQVSTNIFFRIRILREILGNISAYYEYLVSDSDTPEILADKIYGNPEAHWVILMANDIIDPQYDWPLNYKNFNNYIINKYGSIANAKTQIHHYEKVVTREEQLTSIVTETRFTVNFDKLTDNTPTVPYDYYENLPETQEVNTYNLENGRTVTEIIRREAITSYDYEEQLNEKKRSIKIIKPEYYGQILKEFENLTNTKPSYIRKLV